MKFLIQHNLFDEFNRENLIETLNRYQLDYSFFIPFENQIFKSEEINGEIVTSQFIIPTEKTWCFGSVSAAKYMSLLDIKPGSMMNSNHDVEVYGKYYEMLNETNHIMNFSDPLPDWLPEAFFARPTKDSKCFSGSLFMKSSWNEYVNTILLPSFGKTEAERLWCCGVEVRENSKGVAYSCGEWNCPVYVNAIKNVH